MKTSIRNVQTQILSDDWAVLKKVTYEYHNRDGSWGVHVREAYDRGDGVTILLYDPAKRTIILTEQFRLPTYLKGNPEGLMIESCAGKLDEKDPKECIIREVLEETGYEIQNPQKIFELFMSPGSVTEIIHFYLSPVGPEMKKNAGGGLATEQENIEVLEIEFQAAMDMVRSGEIKDAKTVILLQYAYIHQIMGENA